MNSFLSQEELKKIGFKAVGENVFVSRKASIYCAENISLGNNVRIDDFCTLSGKITINNYVHIAAYSALYGGTEGITIKSFANISSRVSIYSVSDDYSGLSMTNPMVPDNYKNVDSRPVVIGKHVIVGASSVILPGVNIMDGCALGAFSFVNTDTKEWSVYVGIPIRKIEDREKNILDVEKTFGINYMKNNMGGGINSLYLVVNRYNLLYMANYVVLAA